MDMYLYLYVSKYDPDSKSASVTFKPLFNISTNSILLWSVFCQPAVWLKGNSPDFTDKGQSMSHGEYYSACVNSCIMSS